MELFSFMLPLLMIVLAIGSGARTLGGEEDAGRLELVFAYPVSRQSAVARRGRVGVETGVFCCAAYAALALVSPVFGLGLPLGPPRGGSSPSSCSRWFTAGSRSRPAAASAEPAARDRHAGGAAAAAYLVGGLHGLAGWLDPFRFLSSFWWAGQAPLSSGVDYRRLLVLALAAAAVLAAALVLIGRRDLETA